MSHHSHGGGLLNRTIDALPYELHLPGGFRFCGPGTKLLERLGRGERGINPLDDLCKSHDISYHLNKDTASRRIADKELEEKAWERFKAKDTPFGERVASWFVTTAMKAKSKLGGMVVKRAKKVKRKAVGGRVKKRQASRKPSKPITLRALIKQARSAIRGSGIKSSAAMEKNKRLLRSTTLTALRAVRKLKGRSKVTRERMLALPKSGGLLPLLPIFAGLSAIGSLAGGAAGVAKAISETRDAKQKLAELQRHNQTMEAIALRKGRGLFFKEHKKGGLGLYMAPYSQYAKNC